MEDLENLKQKLIDVHGGAYIDYFDNMVNNLFTPYMPPLMPIRNYGKIGIKPNRKQRRNNGRVKR